MAKKAVVANARGVTKLKVGDREVPLKLTLGVLADIEEHFEIDSIDALPNSGKAILWVIERMAKAAGGEVTQAQLREADIDIQTFVETLGALTGAAEVDPKNGAAPNA